MGRLTEKNESGRALTTIKPILFNTDMVQAIMDGRKTVTRRLIMPYNRKKAKEQGYVQGSGLWIDPGTDNADKEGHVKDYSVSPCWMSYGCYIESYADYKPEDILYVREKWCRHPALGEYYYAANRKKGAGAPYGLARNEFTAVWNSTIPNGQQDLYSWTANPWVWVIEFECYRKPEE